MRSKLVPHLLPPLLATLWSAALPAQGVVNPSLLRAPDTVAAPIGPAAVVATVRSSVVYVCVEFHTPEGDVPFERASSGVIIDGGGLVLTWKHLVQEYVGADDKKLLVQLDDAANTRLPASIVRIDDATGLALLRVDPPAAGLSALELGPDRPAAGQAVVVVARPEGKEMLAFGGVASPALGSTSHRGVDWRAADYFLSDARNDLRCDGASVVDTSGRLLGLYGSENVKRNVREPTLEDLRQPSFGIVATAGLVRRTFAREFAAAAANNAGLSKAAMAEPGSGALAVAKVAPSVVSVWTGEGDWPRLAADDPGAERRREDLGSGVVLSASGFVVTNAHLVKGEKARIRTGDGKVYPATVVRRHGRTNMALLRAELPANVRLPVPEFVTDDDPLLGETVFAVGNPLGSQVVVSRGVVSALREREGGRIQADADLGSANAGGAIIDASGRVVGIGDGGAVDMIEFAFRMNQVTREDRLTTETNLSTFVGIRALRKLWAD
ncbi:MAG: trypsin-like peptidase domain-containing protein, partial [Planctomycetes bacterium]|nr:trypsin-like peptidase domain-containing protein [Planctomycetota bacterium]